MVETHASTAVQAAIPPHPEENDLDFHQPLLKSFVSSTSTNDSACSTPIKMKSLEDRSDDDEEIC